MDHPKMYHSKTWNSTHGEITVEGPLTSNQLKEFSFHEQLTTFRIAEKQFEAVKKIADMQEGRIITARSGTTIIGYVSYLHADPLERWSLYNMEELMVLGAVEVVPAYRGASIASELIRISMQDPYMENYIIISTEYYWHWDLNGTGLSIWEYRKVMEKMMAKGGLYPAATDDEEITSHPANCLMVRIGENVPEKSIQLFDKLRFLKKREGKNMREGF